MKENVGLQEKIKIIKYNPVKIEEKKNVDSNKKPHIFWTANIRIEKYNNDESVKRGVPDEVQYVEGNTATTKGLFTLWHLAMGDGPSDTSIVYPPGDGGTAMGGFYPLKYVAGSAEYAHIGVGDGTSSAQASDTGLTGTNQCFMPCIDNTPAIGSNPNVLQLKAQFGPDDANNFTWNEWGVANGDPTNPTGDRTASNIVLFNRRQEEMGTKSPGSTWVIIADLTIAPSAS